MNEEHGDVLKEMICKKIPLLSNFFDFRFTLRQNRINKFILDIGKI